MSEIDDTTTDAPEDTPAGENTDATAVVEDAVKMTLGVEITDVGPCRKHVRVTVSRDDINTFHDIALDELSESADVPGFRKGRVPRNLLEKRFRKEISADVKQKVLMQSMEQLAEENELDPINEPNLDVENITIPDEGDFEYEFEVEVRPEFELPDYAGVTIKRPNREITDEEVDAYFDQFVAQYGQRVPVEGAAEADDYVVVDAVFTHADQPLRKMEDLTVRVRPVLAFPDAELEGFDTLMVGAQAGDSRDTELTVSTGSEVIEMRGEKVSVQFEVKDVKRLRPPELDGDFCERLGVESIEDLRAQIRQMLERQLSYEQRQSAREQVLELITDSADWELPEQLVLKQVENALHREILEMRQAGFTSQQIRTRENEMRQHAVETTTQALKEHFVLDKLATQENIEVGEQELQTEITMMALQSGENPRRVRARLMKSGVIENLEAQIRERKAIDFILDKAVYEDVESKPAAESRIEAVSQSICRSDVTSLSDDADDADDLPEEEA